MFSIFEFDGVSWKVSKSGFLSFGEAFSFMQRDSIMSAWPNMYKVHEVK